MAGTASRRPPVRPSRRGKTGRSLRPRGCCSRGRRRAPAPGRCGCRASWPRGGRRRARAWLRSAMALRSMRPRALDPPGGSGAFNHRKGIRPMQALTRRSRSRFRLFHCGGRVETQAAGGGAGVAACAPGARQRAVAASGDRRADEQAEDGAAMLREPPPQRRARTVGERVRAHAHDATAGARQAARFAALEERDSPPSKKKYTPRCGQSMRPLHSASRRQPPWASANRRSSS